MLRITALFAALFLVSCSTARVYYKPLTQRPSGNWEGTSRAWSGYVEEKVGKGKYKVGYEGHNQPDPATCAYFSLVRAAERAVIDGKRYFHVKNETQDTDIEPSHFPERFVPGYWRTVRHRHVYYDRCGHKHVSYHYDRVWEPGYYLPAYSVMNKIHRASLEMQYRSTRGDRHDAHEVLRDALANKRGYGVPKLDPRVMAVLNQKS